MKKTGILYTILILALAAFQFPFAPAARAGQPLDQATAILTAGIWRIQSKQSGLQDRVFNADGTSTLNGGFGRVIKWRIDVFHVTLIYPDHEEELSLPIDPNGIRGKDGKGMDIAASMIGLTRSQSKIPPPLDGRLPSNAPAPAADPSAVNVTNILTSSKWRFTAGAGTVDERTFYPQGTLVVESNGKMAGEWSVAGNLLLMCFHDHTDMLELPLNPQGTKGQGAHGVTYVATQEGAPAAAPVPGAGAQPAAVATGVATAPAHAAPPPAATVSASGADAQTQQSAAILAKGVWVMNGKNWHAIMKFAPDGTGEIESTWPYGPNKAQSGPLKWRIDHFHVTVQYFDNEITINLPINGNGLMGKDWKGVDFTASHGY